MISDSEGPTRGVGFQDKTGRPWALNYDENIDDDTAITRAITLASMYEPGHEILPEGFSLEEARQ